MPNAVCRFGQRVRTTSSGSSNWAGSRLAELQASSTRSPFFIGQPRNSVSCVTVRARAWVGEKARRNSSTARVSSSGCSSS